MSKELQRLQPVGSRVKARFRTERWGSTGWKRTGSDYRSSAPPIFRTSMLQNPFIVHEAESHCTMMTIATLYAAFYEFFRGGAIIETFLFKLC